MATEKENDSCPSASCSASLQNFDSKSTASREGRLCEQVWYQKVKICMCLALVLLTGGTFAPQEQLLKWACRRIGHLDVALEQSPALGAFVPCGLLKRL